MAWCSDLGDASCYRPNGTTKRKCRSGELTVGVTEDVLFSLAIIAFLLAICGMLFMVLRSVQLTRRGAFARNTCFRDHSRDLELAFEVAMDVNRYRPGRINSPPGVRLDAAWRATPQEFRSAAHQIAEVLGTGRVVSVDISQLNQHEAARLVDYCHGLSVMANGWMFRLASNVFVISPGM